MSYEVILFDIDATLLDYKKSEYEAITNSFAYFELEFKEEYHLKEYQRVNHAIWIEFENGVISLEKLKAERFRRFFDTVNIAVDPQEFCDVYLDKLADTVHYIKDAQEVFEAVCQQYRVAFITNGISLVQHRRVRNAGFFDFIEELIISEEVGSQKPDPLIFQHTMEKLKITDKSKVLIIGDNLNSDIKGGINFGIGTCWFNIFKIANKTGLQPTYVIDNLLEFLPILGIDIKN